MSVYLVCSPQYVPRIIIAALGVSAYTAILIWFLVYLCILQLCVCDTLDQHVLVVHFTVYITL